MSESDPDAPARETVEAIARELAPGPRPPQPEATLALVDSVISLVRELPPGEARRVLRSALAFYE